MSICVILIMLNKTKYQQLSVFFKGIIIPFLRITVFEFGKSANSPKQLWQYRDFLVLLSDNRVCVFRCVDFGWRTFLFYR